jgi:enamine deaminase RidA (YjgF/YER057c/UK114 family)
MALSARTMTSAGMTFADVVDNTIYMTDIWQAPAAHKVYAELLGADAPARTTVGTGLVVRNGLIEMMMTAVR